jgi:dihydrofolate synthase/folylpolyglutamate synthase
MRPQSLFILSRCLDHFEPELFELFIPEFRQLTFHSAKCSKGAASVTGFLNLSRPKKKLDARFREVAAEVSFIQVVGFSSMDYKDSVSYLYSLGNEVLTAKLGLFNISTLLGFIGSPHKKFQSILIAGTNGKGSVAAYISQVLHQAGFVTGLYSSPHLNRIEERIQIGGTTISEADFSRITGHVKTALDQLMVPDANLNGKARLDRHPTYFELVTAIAFQYFAEQKVGMAVLEVGLGGRLDATNVVDPVVAVITNVDMDHQCYLGESLEEIASEKAGIIKPRTYLEDQPLPVVCSSSKQVVVDMLEKQCLAAGACLNPVLEYYQFTTEADALGRYCLTIDCEFGSGIRMNIPLAGDHQILNVLTAIRVCELLHSMGFGISRENLQLGIEQTRWPGRMEIAGVNPYVILDGAHNPAAAACVKAYVEKFLNHRKIVLIFAAMRDKAIAEIGSILFPLGEEIILTKLDMERAAEPMEIAGTLPEFKALYRYTESSESALLLAQRLAGPDDVILVVGSLFLIGEVKRYLKSVSAI